MIDGTTRTGFKFSVSERALSDMRVVDAMADMERGGTQSLVGLSDIAVLLIGREGKAALYAHLEDLDPDGIPGMEQFSDELKDILEAVGGKN